MNFVLASDDNFAPFLSVTLVSLIENNVVDSEPLYIYILNDNISEDNKKHINSLVNDNNVHLSFIDTRKLDDMDFSVSGIKRNFNESLTTYARLFVASLLPEDVDKVIYLDCDALVLGSFKELWDMDLEDNYAAAVLDICSSVVKETLGFKLDENYFNAGMLLINLKKWRKDNVEELFIKFMEDNQHRFYQHDQGTLNNVLKNKIAIADPKFNLAGYFNFLDYDLALKFSAITEEYYNKTIINKAYNNPVFVHLTGNHKPPFNKYHPYRKTYEKYVELAGYDKDKIFKDANFTVKLKLFYKVLNNPLLKISLRLYPNFLLYNYLTKMYLTDFKKVNEKERELIKNN